MQQPTEMSKGNLMSKDLFDMPPRGMALFDFVVPANEIEKNTAFANTQQSIDSKG
jgi:hypothetical protein